MAYLVALSLLVHLNIADPILALWPRTLSDLVLFGEVLPATLRPQLEYDLECWLSDRDCKPYFMHRAAVLKVTRMRWNIELA